MSIPLNSSAYSIAGWIGVALMAAAAVWLGLQTNWLGCGICLLFLVATAAFMIFRSGFPALFDLLFVIAALANGAGWVWEFYSQILYYDEVVHAYTAFAASLSLGFALYYSARAHLSTLVFALAILTIGIALGAIWEMFEWLIIDIRDPVSDLMVDTLGAALAAIFGTWVLQVEAR